MSSTKTCLVVFYNHHFPENIGRINALYESRFDEVVHLLPFLEEETSDTVSVARSSHSFSGFFHDARSVLRSSACERFLFIADDLLLNPKVNSHSLDDCFGLSGAEDAFVATLKSFDTQTSFWRHASSALSFHLLTQARDLRHALPSRPEAFALLERHNVASHSVKLRALYPSKLALIYALVTHLFRKLDGLLRRGLGVLGKDDWRVKLGLELEYPLAHGYSDIFLVPKSNFEKFAHYCGVFAAGGLFSEIAVPTAIALSCDTVLTEDSAPLRGGAIWGNSRNELQKNNRSLSRLMVDFPRDLLYIHPIKLSEWGD